MADAGRGGARAEGKAGAGTVVDRVTGGVSQLQSRFAGMPAPRRTWWAAGGALVLAVLAAMFWYASRPDWRTLFSGLDGKDVQQVSQELAAAGIPFEVTDGGGAVQVPAEQLEKARMEVATKGMPQTGRLGFELFDKPNWVGSEFDERVNYQRALEGELEHTIETLDVVRTARVHLVLPQATLFSGQEKVAKASVVLKLKRPAMPAEQADSIRSLVAGAVENLSTAEVTLVDADGRVNLQPRNGIAAAAGEEQALETKLVAMLEPLAGLGNVRATVNVSYDQSTEERTDEVYDPAASAALTVKKTEQQSSGATRASGVPGTASNTPAASAEGAVQGTAAAASPGTPPLLAKAPLPVYPQNGGPTQSVKEENGTYAVSRHITHTETGAGRLRRLTAAVVVNDRQVIEGAGKLQHTVWKPRSPEEMRRLEDLAQAAVGYEMKRGDQVVMQNIAFDSNTPEAKPQGLERVVEGAKGLMPPNLLRVGMIGLLGVLVVLVVLKPMMGQMVATLREPLPGSYEMAMLPAPEGVAATGLQGVEGSAAAALAAASAASSAAGALGAGGGSERSLGAGAGSAEEAMHFRPKGRAAIFDHVSEYIRREPGQSTRLLETWIGSSEGSR
jgi:flagellar M-ring protein FliF